jgi:hypothetical protein
MSKTSHADKDAAVRAALSSRGDTGQAPRHTLFFFYGGDLKGLRAAATAAGYSSGKTVGRSGVVLETETAVDESSFAAHSKRMAAWADEFGSDYDGWECQLMIQ